MRFLARSASVLVGLQLEDAAGELNQTNLPGPDQGHPNWKRRHQTDIETLTAPGGDLAKIAAALAEEGRGLKPNAGMLSGPPPRATYRLQFHSAFTFDDAVRIVPYLAALGISHVYASPIQTARPHSTHGYDIVDHATINPELGGEDGFFRLTDALRDNGLGLVLDVVPNHMGVGGADNAWWLSVLEWGELSSFGNAFDIDWERLGANHKLIVPFLSGGYGDVLEKGDLNLTFDAAEGSFSVWHFEHRFPLCPLSYPVILDRALAALPDGNDQGAADLIAISERLRTMNDEAAPDHRRGFPDESAALKSRLAETVAASGAVRQAIERAVVLVNGTPGIPESFGTLHRILETQSYRLAYWRVAASDINYRRFFDINALAGLRVEDPVVFERSHAMIFRLVREGRIQGLRIDHVDGLADPESYVRALQSAVGPGFYILVEKILEPGEELRPWPIAGTTGYEVLNQLDGIFVDSSSADRLESLYRAATAFEGRYGVLLREAKAEVLESSFASELEGAVSDLKRLADSDRRTRDYTVYAIHRALVEIVARLPVYRTYLGESEPGPEDRALIESTIEAAKRSSMLPDRTVHDFAAAIILGDAMPEGAARLDSDLVRRFRRRFQQLTGPVMAKSLEDTLFYRYVRMLSLNEVGGDPNRFGVSLDEFHRANVARARLWPHSLIATATHDTKRGEDARARLSVLSEIPQIWGEALDAWAAASVPHLTLIAGEKAPDANDRYLILQSILGAWPIELLGDEENEPAVGDFRDRIESYALKAVREAKRYTSWVHGNAPYEEAIAGFVRGILDPQSPFVREFRPLARRMAYAGMLTSLSRTVLKCTIPGVPDFYQGTEWWDLSLVDPDNRRPIDYEKRAEALLAPEPTQALMGTWPDGRLKQRLVAILLADRGAAPALYANGDYRPLKVTGPKAGHVIAFVRSSAAGRVAVIVPRVTGALLADGKLPFGTAWDGTGVSIPRGEWRDLFTGAKTSADGGVLPLDAIFARLPFCVLRADHDAAEATKP
jgi:(1->4)-alpha-D-glucan 1-alpha-D-glucosylmutase